jgi:hypothetical protein
MAAPFTPAEQARLDQDMADLNRRLDILLGWFTERTAVAGLEQATADLALAFTALSHGEPEGLLLAAVRRLGRPAVNPPEGTTS